MKHLVGKQVWLIPTGNNARGRGRQQACTGTVESVARVFVNISIGGSSRCKRMRINDRNGRIHLDAGSNSGYMVFESSSAIDDYQESKEIGLKINNLYRYSSDWELIDISVLRQVADLLGVQIKKPTEVG